MSTSTAGVIPDEFRAHALDVLGIEIIGVGQDHIGKFDSIDGQTREQHAHYLAQASNKVSELSALYTAIVEKNETHDQALVVLHDCRRDIAQQFEDGAPATLQDARELIEAFDEIDALLDTLGGSSEGEL